MEDVFIYSGPDTIVPKDVVNVRVVKYVKRIGTYAFANCISLKNITIPNRVKYIGNYAFANCISLSGINLPDGIKSIRYRTFANCTSLKNITIPNSVKRIGSYAFDNCTSLSGINLPEGIERIGNDSFRDCRSLTRVTIPASTDSIGIWAFSGCINLETVIFNTYDGIILPQDIINSYSIFSHCPKLKSVLIRIRGNDKLIFKGIFGLIGGIFGVTGCTNIHLIRLKGYKLEYDISFYDNIKTIFRAGTGVLIEDKTDEYYDAFTVNVYKDKERTTFETFVLNMKSLFIPMKDVKLGELDMSKPVKEIRLPRDVVEHIRGFADGNTHKKLDSGKRKSRKKSRLKSNKKKTRSRKKSKRRKSKSRRR